MLVDVGFFDSNRKQLAQLGIDPKRLPPGQYFTDRFPVLHVGNVPDYGDLSDWSLTVNGATQKELNLSWQDVLDREKVTIQTDIHCVTKWSKFDTTWAGCSLADLIREAGPSNDATHVMFHCEFGYTTNLPLVDLLDQVSLLAYEFDGQSLTGEHGYPLRTLVPHLYLWKSAKWIRGIELMTADKAGFWERNGYSMYGDPFREQRHRGDK
jgi:DMSO/TMAO reductase YedYZ molybdopterin-dependent catalytic subunit